MKKFKKYIEIIFLVLAIIIAICSILSIFRNEQIRFLKMLDFPRIQIFIVSFLSLIIVGIMLKKHRWYYNVIFIGLLIGMVINGSYLINYTPLVSTEVPTVSDIKESDDVISLLVTNVKMSNENAEPLLKLIERKNPDLILAMEVNDRWSNDLKVLEKDYPYYQCTINEVTYGMTLYSKFPLAEINVDYMNNKKVPSFESTIELSNDKYLNLYCLHPVPPTHFKDLPDNAGKEEVAMKKLGKKISNSQYPSIVAGDLNDVVWSHVDVLTRTKDLLFDVRVGRGFYNSYNAENIFMRWPLDHIFVTKEFRLKTLERLDHIGSDHYPIFVELVL